MLVLDFGHTVSYILVSLLEAKTIIHTANKAPLTQSQSSGSSISAQTTCEILNLTYCALYYTLYNATTIKLSQ